MIWMIQVNLKLILFAYFFLDLSLKTVTTPVLMTTSPMAAKPSEGSFQEVSAVFIPLEEAELLSKMTSNGFQVNYRYSRTPYLYSDCMTGIQLSLSNLSSEDLSEVKIGAKNDNVHEFPAVALLKSNACQNVNIGINFKDSTQAAKFDLVASGRVFTLQIQPRVGELMRPISMAESSFDAEKAKLRGMNEVEASFDLPSSGCDDQSIKKKLYQMVNVVQVPALNEKELKFAGKTVSQKCLVLIALNKLEERKVRLTVNCEKIVVGNMLVKDIKKCLME